MRKIFALIVVLLLISGCINLPENPFKIEKKEAPGRAVSVEFVQLPSEIRLGRDFSVAVRAKNNLDRDIDFNLIISDNLHSQYEGIRDDSEGVFLRAKQDKIITFGPYVYNEEVLAKQTSIIQLVLEIVDYEADLASKICIDDPNIRGGCSFRSSLVSGDFGEEALIAPISVERVDIEEFFLDYGVKLGLVIHLKNYGGEIDNLENKITYLNINLVGGETFECESYDKEDKYLVVEDNKAKVYCEAVLYLEEREYPLQISFGYPYKLTKYSKPIDIV